MNIIYGGAFNPITKAHKKIIEELITKYNPDNFIIVPVGDIYNKNDLISFNHRVNMINLSLNDINIVISDIENKSKVFLGTYDLLNKLNNIYKDLYFVMGADNIINIKQWIDYDKLINDYNFIIINRDNFNINTFINNNLSEYKDKFNIINFNSNISSTNIRINLDKYKNDIDNKVYDYIKNNDLYKGV